MRLLLEIYGVSFIRDPHTALTRVPDSEVIRGVIERVHYCIFVKGAGGVIKFKINDGSSSPMVSVHFCTNPHELHILRNLSTEVGRM